MKKLIDWSKPIRYNSFNNAKNLTCTPIKIDQGYYILTYTIDNKIFYTAADDHGKILCTDNMYVENIPEEPRDHIIVFKTKHQNKFYIDDGCGNLLTKTNAEEYIKINREEYNFIDKLKVL